MEGELPVNQKRAVGAGRAPFHDCHEAMNMVAWGHMKQTVVKVLLPGTGDVRYTIEHGGDCIFAVDARLDEYDWLLVYDEVPDTPLNTGRPGLERLACPRERTILVTAEPPSIKLYAPGYLAQFGHVLTTHPQSIVRHPGYRVGLGTFLWFYSRPYGEFMRQKAFPKTQGLSVVCSSKAMKHTRHYDRLQLVRAVSRTIPELQWFGHGVRPIGDKAEALTDFRYHLAIENHIAPHHWTEKLSDAFLAACLPFYAGDPAIFDVFPEDSLIPLSIDDPERACAIIREAIDGNEYERRLPAILEARRLVLTRYNVWAQAQKLIRESEQAAMKPAEPTSCPHWLRSRHRLRHDPRNLLSEGWNLWRNRQTRRSL